jgi:hypothetical protein
MTVDSSAKSMIRTDPATGFPLPAQIDGVPIPNNFDSSKPQLWPIHLGAYSVGRWKQSHTDAAKPETPAPPQADLRTKAWKRIQEAEVSLLCKKMANRILPLATQLLQKPAVFWDSDENSITFEGLDKKSITVNG